MASRVQQKARLRAEREARAAAAAAREARTRRIGLLLTALGAAAMIVAAAIAISSGGSGEGGFGGPVTGATEVEAMLAGVPQDGLALGRPDAPVTLVEFADLQCPYCRDSALATLPGLVQDHVRNGKLRIEFRNFAILGADSEKAARAVQSAADQGRAWQFIDLFYRNQGEERSGYVTDDFLHRVASGVSGLDADAVVRASNAGGEVESVETARREAGIHGIDSTPSFLIGRTGERLRPLPLGDPRDPAAFVRAIEAESSR